ncbi:hypothetical protein I6E20_14945 [Bacteroides caecigallinarum]|nr:hypothetical protein [Bacteroides caecigallinarum]
MQKVLKPVVNWHCRFVSGLQEAIKFIDDNSNHTNDYNTEEKTVEDSIETSSDIKIDIEF